MPTNVCKSNAVDMVWRDKMTCTTEHCILKSLLQDIIDNAISLIHSENYCKHINKIEEKL